MSSINDSTHPRYARRSNSVVSTSSAVNQDYEAGMLSNRRNSICSQGRGRRGSIDVKRQFFKTQMCSLYMMGKCALMSEECGYCHDESELRVLPDLSKTRMCPKGESCDRKDTCSFAHDASELRSTGNIYKSKLCKFFETTGTCSSADKCRFAHGTHELSLTDDNISETTMNTISGLDTTVSSANFEERHNEDDDDKASVCSSVSCVFSEADEDRLAPQLEAHVPAHAPVNPIGYVDISGRRWSVCTYVLPSGYCMPVLTPDEQQCFKVGAPQYYD